MKKCIKILVFLILLLFSVDSFSQEVSIVLKNSRVIVGSIIEEKPNYILLNYELGQLRLDRNSIESITYNPFIKYGTIDELQKETSVEENTQRAQRFVINDPVVIYLRNGKIVSGLLLAKSLNMVMLQTESGNLTIPKRDLLKIEYVSSEFAERGEIVIALLNNGQRFEGNIYYEDSKELTLDTQVGRLTLPKNNLRTLEYTGKTGVSIMTMADQYAGLLISDRILLSRYDVIDLSYSSKFGPNFGPGFGIGYSSKLPLSRFEGFDLSGVGGISVSYFGLNEAGITTQFPTLGANIKGGAAITTLGAGAQLNIYPQATSFYDFYVAPMLEGHFIYSKLDQTYPSFPQFNSSQTSTDFKFGFGTRFGVEFIFDAFRLAAQYSQHYIFGADDYSQFSLTLVTTIF